MRVTLIPLILIVLLSTVTSGTSAGIPLTTRALSYSVFINFNHGVATKYTVCMLGRGGEICSYIIVSVITTMIYLSGFFPPKASIKPNH